MSARARTSTRRVLLLVAAALLLAGCLTTGAADAHAQGIAERVKAVGNGRVQLRFASRDGVCGDGRTFVRMGRSFHGTMDADWSRVEKGCTAGPVRVVLRVEDGRVVHARTSVGPAPTAVESGVTDLGAVPSRDAAAYLLSIAGGADGRGEEALLGAVLADSAVVWPGLLAIARDAGTNRKARREASHWLGRFAAAKQAGHPDRPWDEDDDDSESPEVATKKSAVFALSQLRGGAGVEPLLAVARTNREPAVRSQAMFWLGQTDDRRAIDLFEEVLRK